MSDGVAYPCARCAPVIGLGALAHPRRAGSGVRTLAQPTAIGLEAVEKGST